MRLSLQTIVFLAALWVAQSVWACPRPKLDWWSPNPVCVGCESVLALSYIYMPGYEVTSGPWVDSITIAPTSNSPTADGNTNGWTIQWSAPGYCSVVVTTKLDYVCLSNNVPGTSTNVIVTPFIVARMDTFTLMDAGNENNSRQDTTDDDATPTNNTLVICEDADGTAEVEIDLSLTPTNANVGYLFHWQIEGGGWTPANGDFSSGAITSVWTNAGGDVNREFTVAVHCDCGAGGNCEYCAYRRMLKIAVFKVDLLQAGFDSMDTNKWVSLKKTGSDTYTNDTYISDGNTAITNPVWQDLNLNDIPDVNPPDPVCFVKEAVPMIVQGKLDIKPGIGTNVIDVTDKG